MSHPRDIAAGIARQLQEAGFIGVFAGGCVRDRFLGVEPKDYDVATNATPDEIKAVFHGDVCLLVGEQFGVIVVIRDKVQVEVATLRNDGQYGDGRRPDSVVFVTDSDPKVALRGDAARRDLTINAMFEDPLTGEVFDFFSGKADIEARIIRAVGDASKRFAEDRVRMLRVVRFAAKLGFTVCPTLLKALKKHARSLRPSVAWERITSELEGILTSKAPVVGLNLLLQTGLLKQVLPEALPMNSWRGFQDPNWHPEGRTWSHMCLVLNVAVIEAKAPSFKDLPAAQPLLEEMMAALSSFEFRLALLLHDIAKPKTQKWSIVRRQDRRRWFFPWQIRVSNHSHAEVGAEMAEAICRRLKLSNDQKRLVIDIVALHMKMHDYNNPEIRPGKLVRLLERSDIVQLILMQHCDAMGTGQPLAERQKSSLLHFYLELIARMKSDPVATRRPGAAALITGKEIKEFGFKQGPIFKVIKEAALNAQHEGAFTDMEGAKAWLAAHLEEFRRIPSPQ